MFLCNRTAVQEKQRPVLKNTQWQCYSALNIGQKRQRPVLEKIGFLHSFVFI